MPVRRNKTINFFFTMKIYHVLLVLWTLFTLPAFGQLGMGGQPHSSAALDVKATDKAFYPPRLTTIQRKAIADPQPGAFVYDLDQTTFYLFDGQRWLPLATQNPMNPIPATRLADDGNNGDQFGGTVAISGDYALVGAASDKVGTNASQGSAYVFVRNGNTWSQQAKLTASDGAAFDKFGWSVAISGDYALVSAYTDDIGANVNQGSAYVFMRDGTNWTQQAKLTAGDGAANDEFGSSVSISGDYAVVGASKDDVLATVNQGSAYVFLRNGTNWNQQGKLTAGDGAASDELGISVVISGSHVIAGVPRDDINANVNQGSAYVFVRNGNTWSQQEKVVASDGAANDEFGTSVALSGDNALVGADGLNLNQGTVYSFVRFGNDWLETVKLHVGNGSSNNRFGSSVSISGDYAIVGAPNRNGDTYQGAVYLFRRTGSTWFEVRFITDTAPYTQNGHSVAISNGSFIIGGPSFDMQKGKVSFGTTDN